MFQYLCVFEVIGFFSTIFFYALDNILLAMHALATVFMIVSIALFGAATCSDRCRQKCGFMVVLICFVTIGSQ